MLGINKKTTLFFTIAAVAFSQFSAHAQVRKTGPYMGIDLGFGQISHGNLNDTTPGNDLLAKKFNFGSAYLGYQYSKKIAFEAGYFKTQKEDKTFDGALVGNAANVTSNIELDGVYFDVVLNQKLAKKLYGIASIGYAWFDFEPSFSISSVDPTGALSDDQAFRAGIGTLYEYDKNILLKSKVDYMDASDGAFLYSFGAQYKIPRSTATRNSAAKNRNIVARTK